MSYPALTALVVATVWLVLSVRSLVNNLHQARRSGLPYALSLVTEVETWAYLTDHIIRKLYRKHLLVQQQGWPRWARFMVKDWMYEDKYRAHAELGDMFLVVFPGSIVCYVADPDLAQEVCMRRRDFIKPREKMKMIEPFGPNVVSSEGDLWRFHYHITAPPFGDAANYLSDEAPPSGHQLSLLDAVYGIVTYLPLLLLLPKWLLRNDCKPAWVAFVEFEKHMREYIAEEQSVVREHNLNKKKGHLGGNLLTALLATNANEQTCCGSKGGQRVALTEDEVIGNMFMFFMAGYDTTANTIIFSCVALALFDNVQQGLLDELDQVVEFSQSQGRTELSYTEDFPRFRYMLAFMYETLRFFPVVLPIGRVASGTQNFKPTGASDLPFALPSDCGIVVNITGVYYNKKCWPEPHTFEPKRWLCKNPNSYIPSSCSNPDLDPNVRIPNHKRGTFLTFSEGPRACLGRRFAQAEFICFFAEVLKHHRLRLAQGVDRVDVEKLFRSCSAGSLITLAPPSDIGLMLEQR